MCYTVSLQRNGGALAFPFASGTATGKSEGTRTFSDLVLPSVDSFILNFHAGNYAEFCNVNGCNSF